MNLKDMIRTVPNWPIEGVMFRDITTLLMDPAASKVAYNKFYNRYKDMEIDKVAAIDARGFIFGSVLAFQLDVGLIPIRKKGKLPYETISAAYTLEYGENVIEMHEDALSVDDVILIHDDLLATGGTAYAALKLAQRLGVKKIYFSFICDLEFIKTIKKDSIKKYETLVLVKY